MTAFLPDNLADITMYDGFFSFTRGQEQTCRIGKIGEFCGGTKNRQKVLKMVTHMAPEIFTGCKTQISC